VTTQGSDSRSGCAWTRAITALEIAAPGDGVVLTSVWHGPEILWRTRHSVVGAPYEIPAALRDTEAFMSGDETTAHAIVLERHVALVLVCKGESTERFAARLARGSSPAWLQQLRLGSGLPEFRFYRVVEP